MGQVEWRRHCNEVSDNCRSRRSEALRREKPFVDCVVTYSAPAAPPSCSLIHLRNGRAAASHLNYPHFSQGGTRPSVPLFIHKTTKKWRIVLLWKSCLRQRRTNTVEAVEEIMSFQVSPHQCSPILVYVIRFSCTYTMVALSRVAP